MAPAEVKREGDDYDIPNEVDAIRLMNESRSEPYHGCEAGPSNEEATNMNVEDGGTDVKKKWLTMLIAMTWLVMLNVLFWNRNLIRSKMEKLSTMHAGEGGKYVVTHFVADHNHELEEQHCVMYLRSHRSLNSVDKAQAMAMCNVGVKTSQIMDYMVNQYGFYENVCFIRTDLHNHIQAKRRAEVEDGDAQGALVYLCAKLDVDAHSKSRADYAKFGDVLIFDSTYRTNAYKKPFVMLAGVTSHFRTAIFACVLLANETIDTYTWVLETFTEAMGNKAPMSVLTERDKMM
ncbi:protein FAR1-RELATED SEQUENCE 5-like [Camellia sinensis]|uniref:protein FAR1-RELATED SEQUENCE 5-like n=1 Tax=Camellia sinensis TaxID=4442 RepID=UPI001035BE0E|nr:protein FAR1-RELATED SEQUENCE 5-like [Camellia sinensis]